MNNPLKKYAPIGLYISLIAAIATAGFYIVQRKFNLPVQISLGLMIIGLSLFVFFDPQKAKETFTGKQAKYGSNVTLLTIAVIGILVVLNYMGAQYTKKWDLTQDKTNSLSNSSIEVLKTLEEPVTVQAFYTPRFSSDTAQKVLENYKTNGGGKFAYSFIDPEANPLAAQAAKITRDGVLVISIGDRSEQVTFPTEQEITSAIIRLSNPGERTVYFLTGHGEYDPNGTGQGSYSQLRQTLTAKNYNINTLNLISSPSVPENALSVIIAGPQKPISEEELAALKNYQEKGGSLVLLSEPNAITGLTNDSDPFAAYLRDYWGVQLQNDIVIEPNMNPPLMAVADQYADHLITQKMMGLTVIFPTARSLSVTDALPDGIQTDTIVFSSTTAWGETSIEELKTSQVKSDINSDLMGPLPLIMVAENPTTKARLVVSGDSDFASDQYFTNLGNGDFITNCIDWASEQDSLINLNISQPTNRILIPPNQITLGLILLITVFLLPGVVIFIGITVWIQRKRRA